MKRNVILGAAFAAMAALTLTGCNNQSGKMDEKPAANNGDAQSEFKIAYVEVDSLTTQYEFYKVQSEILQKKGENIQKTLAGKERELQNAANNFQQKLQNNAYTREQAEAEQARIQRMQQNAQGLAQRLQNEFDEESAKFLKAVQDSLDHFLASYNKDKKYSMILSKAGLLYADKAYDITADVINGMNKAYKKSGGKKAEEKKDDKAEASKTATSKPIDLKKAAENANKNPLKK